jgi:hypothetical protein
MMVLMQRKTPISRLALTPTTALEPATGPDEAARLIVTDFDRLYHGVHRYLLHRFFDAELAAGLTAQTFYKLAAA